MKLQKYILVLLTTICLFPFINSTWALLLGLFFALIIGNPVVNFTNQWGGYLLKTSVIGLGFGINIQVLLKAGQQNIGTTTIFVLIALGGGILLGKLLKLDSKITLLIASGTAICGGSAIAAIGSVIKADSNQLSVSTGNSVLTKCHCINHFSNHWTLLGINTRAIWYVGSYCYS